MPRAPAKRTVGSLSPAVSIPAHADRTTAPGPAHQQEGRAVLVEEINGSSERRYIVHAFAKWCQQNQPELFSWLVSLVKGYMLANALLCDDLNNLPKSFGSVRVYFDTPLMIRLLGYEGLVQQGPAEELRQQLQHWRVPLAVFEHTMAELEGVLRGAELDYDNLDCKIPVARAMRNMGKSKSDITLAKTRLREDTARLGFSIVNAPEYDSTRREQIDESKFTDILDTLVNYRDDLARKTDVKSVRSIYALRKGRRPYQLEDAIAVFVTTNAGLAKAGLDYGRFTENQREVTPVTTDFSLSNYIWLKSPMQRPDLPMLEIIASCQAANMPTDSMWEKYLAEINKLKQLGQISERDHQLLRASPVVGETLMGLTLGSEPALGERTIMQILEAAKQDLVREERHKTEEEKKSRLAAEQNLAEAKDRLAAKDERDAARIRNLEARSERYGRRVALIITVPLFLILLAVMVAASIPNIASTIGVSIRAPVKILIWAVVLW
jgi:hypothetical protein